MKRKESYFSNVPVKKTFWRLTGSHCHVYISIPGTCRRRKVNDGGGGGGSALGFIMLHVRLPRDFFMVHLERHIVLFVKHQILGLHKFVSFIWWYPKVKSLHCGLIRKLSSHHFRMQFSWRTITGLDLPGNVTNFKPANDMMQSVFFIVVQSGSCQRIVSLCSIILIITRDSCGCHRTQTLLLNFHSSY